MTKQNHVRIARKKDAEASDSSHLVQKMEKVLTAQEMRLPDGEHFWKNVHSCIGASKDRPYHTWGSYSTGYMFS